MGSGATSCAACMRRDTRFGEQCRNHFHFWNPGMSCRFRIAAGSAYGVRYTSCISSSRGGVDRSSPEVSIMMKIFCRVVLLLASGTLLAQSTPPAAAPSPATSSTPTPSAATAPSQQTPFAHHGGQGGCLQEAGIDKSVMEQIRTISSSARSRVEGICSDTSLTAQQRNQQAREIREQAMQKRDALLTSDQRQALASCQHPHGGTHEGGGRHEGAGGGCDEMPRGGQRHGGYNRPGNGGGSSAPSSAPPSSSEPQN